MIQRAHRQQQRLYSAVVFKFFILCNVEKLFSRSDCIRNPDLHVDTGGKIPLEKVQWRDFSPRWIWISSSGLYGRGKKAERKNFCSAAAQNLLSTSPWVGCSGFVMPLQLNSVSAPSSGHASVLQQASNRGLNWRGVAKFSNIRWMKIFFILKATTTDWWYKLELCYLLNSKLFKSYSNTRTTSLVCSLPKTVSRWPVVKMTACVDSFPPETL